MRVFQILLSISFVCLVATESNRAFAEAKCFGVYSETCEGCILYDDPDACCRIGTYSNSSSRCSLFADLTGHPEGVESMRAEIYVTSGGWAGWFVQWGTEWQQYPNEDSVIDMSIYANGSLRFWVRTPIDLIIGIRSSNIYPGGEASKVNLAEYCAIDSAWYEVSIPISDFASEDDRLELAAMKILFNVARVGGTGGNRCFWIDNVRWFTDFYIENVTPSRWLNSGIVIDTIIGEGFKEGAEVKLAKGSSIIPGTNTSVVSSQRIVTSFDLTGAEIGDWDLVVTNPDSKSATLTEGFTIKLLKPPSTGPVTVQGRSIIVDGASYTIKGVGYSPTPIGESPEAGWSFPDYPSGDTLIYPRDFNLLRLMNCNTIRTWGEVTEALLDKAEENTLKVICGFWVGYDLDLENSTVRDNLISDFRAYVAKFEEHPAVLMWSIGNEQNYQNGNNAAWYSLVNEMAQAAYEEEGDTYHPVTTPNGELHNIGVDSLEANSISLNYLDVWGANIYRGLSFGNLFAEYETCSTKPFWVSEYGIDAWDHQSQKEGQETQAICAHSLWEEMEFDSDICCGGTIMAYCDEWWKNGDPDTHDSGGYEMPAFPDGWSDEEYWGVMRVEADGNNPDIMDPRVTYYTLQSKWGTAQAVEVYSIVPNSAPNTGDIQVTIVGSYFQAQAEAKLIKEDSTITGRETVAESPDTIITTFSLAQATPGIWTLLVTNADGQSDTLTEGFVITDIPSPPSNLQAILGDQAVVLEWTDNSDNELGFQIWRGTSSDVANWDSIGTTPANVTTFTDDDPAVTWNPPTKYFYGVRAYNNTGCSDYAVAEILTCVYVSPNPFVPSRGHKLITFKGSGVIYAIIRIYTLDGDLVRTLKETKGTDIITWDTRNDSDRPVASGIYIWTSENPLETSKGKIAIIR